MADSRCPQSTFVTLHQLGRPTAFLLMPLLAAAVHAADWQVTVTSLGDYPGGIFSSAYAINDNGVIVGVAQVPGQGNKPVKWVNGTISLLAGPVGGGSTTPEDINNNGEIAGRYSISADQSYGVYWDASGAATLLPGLPGAPQAFVLAHAINASGQIVGRAQQGAPTLWGHAVVWNQTAFQTDIGFLPGGTFSEAFGINAFGEVVGIATNSSATPRAFLFKNGTLTDLSTWPGGAVTSKAYAINNAGTIVGQNGNFPGVWKNGSVTTLTMPPGVSQFTFAVDINDAGDIIATAPKVFPVEIGVIWKNNQPLQLPPLPGGTTTRARRLNNLGEVVGESNAADGFFHAVKWTITPVGGACLGDLDVNALVDASDLALLLGAWGTTNASADLSDNGTVGGEDLAILLGAWGACN